MQTLPRILFLRSRSSLFPLVLFRTPQKDALARAKLLVGNSMDSPRSFPTHNWFTVWYSTGLHPIVFTISSFWPKCANFARSLGTT
jgi:hypothetical protein